MNAKDSRSRTQRKVNLAESYGKKWIRNYSPNRGVYFRIEEEVSSFHSGQEYQSLVLFSHDSNLIRGTNVVADSMLFSPALVLDRAIAPFLAVSFPTLSDAHWA